MQPRFQTIALIGKFQTPEIAETLHALADFLLARGCQVLLEEATAASVGCRQCGVADFEVIGAQADLAVVIGGDGSMLNAARRLAHYEVPLAGVNLGRLGFMTDIASQNMLESVAALLAGEFVPERRHLLDAELWRADTVVFSTVAFNDVVVNKGDFGRMIEIEVRVDDEFLYFLRADGMIIATPTGSTAYALSANGPILHPAVPGLALVPLCPHALSNRPITISDQSRIDIVLLPQYGARIHFDGQAQCEAVAGDRLHVERSQHAVTLLHPPGYSYFAMLRQKLRWSELPYHTDPS